MPHAVKKSVDGPGRVEMVERREVLRGRVAAVVMRINRSMVAMMVVVRVNHCSIRRRKTTKMTRRGVGVAMVEASSEAIVWGCGDIGVKAVFWADIGGEGRRKSGFKVTHG